MEDRMLMQKMFIGSEFSGVRKGAWTPEEDLLLKKCVEKHGEGQWHLVPTRAGLRRCRKSCRLRWVNYLKPNIKKGAFDEDEVDLIIRLHRLLGNRWSLIAGRIPGRTANDIKNLWNSCLCKKVDDSNNNKATAMSTYNSKPPRHAAGIVERATVGISSSTVLLAPSYSVIKPQPGIPSKSFGPSILPNNNVGTCREARREPSTVVTDGMRPIDDKVADPLQWFRDLLGVVLEEEDGVDGRQKQLLQEVREQENLGFSFPRGGAKLAGEVNQCLVTGGTGGEEEGSDEGQYWLAWEDMSFLDDQEQTTSLGDLLGPEVDGNNTKATAASTYAVEARREPSTVVTDGMRAIDDKEADPLPWLRDLLGVVLEEEDGVDGRQKQLLREVPEQENVGYSFPRGGAQAAEVELLVTEVGSDEGQYWWSWEDMSLLDDQETSLGDLLGPDGPYQSLN